MKCKILLLSLFICAFYIQDINAQSVSGVNFTQEGNYLVINYNLLGDISNAQISLYVSTDGGATFKGPLQKVSGDVGNSVTPGNNKKIHWDVMNEMSNLSGDIVFDVRAQISKSTPDPKQEVKKEKSEKIYLNKYMIAFTGNGFAPIGLTFARLGKIGGYASIRLDPDLSTAADYTTDGANADFPWQPDDSYEGIYTYTGESYSGYFNMSAGLTFQVAKAMHLYGGLDYTFQAAFYELEDENAELIYVQDLNQSYGSVNLELGVLFNFNFYVFGLGVSSLANPDFLAGSFTFGFVF